MSLSARRAWIEIDAPSSAPYAELVALRKESVDRNLKNNIFIHHNLKSLSARRAWIEIQTFDIDKKLRESLSARRAWIEIRGRRHSVHRGPVALRKESVDRNCKSL